MKTTKNSLATTTKSQNGQILPKIVNHKQKRQKADENEDHRNPKK